VLTYATAADCWQETPHRLATAVVLHRVTDRITRYSELAAGRLLSQSCGRGENERSMVKDKLALAFST
jgi:hypothetical protein